MLLFILVIVIRLIMNLSAKKITFLKFLFEFKLIKLSQVQTVSTNNKQIYLYTITYLILFYRLIMDLSAINKYLNELLLGVQGYCNELYPEQQVLPMDQTNNIKKECDQVRITYHIFFN